MRKNIIFIFLVFLSGYAIAQPTVADTTKFRVFDRAGSWISTGSILKTYFQGVGSTSITTLGAITTGTWNASTIPILYGGSGQTTANAALNAFLPSQATHSGKFLQTDGSNTSWVASSGSGTVTSVSVVTANGFAGTVATATTTPAITISTGITGLLKGNGTSVTAAVNSDLPVMTATVGGAVPTPPNNTTTFLRGDGTFATPAGGSGSVATDAIWTAKGQIAVGTGTATASALAVGTDGGQIYADASTSTGLRWLPSVISPAQITSDQDNYAPTGWAKCQVLRIDGDNGQRAITSLAATFAGDIKTISNIGSFPVYFPSEHPDGTAANRIAGSKDNILPPGKSAQIFYDGTSSRWRWLSDIPDWDQGRLILYRFRPGSITAADWGNVTFTVSGGTTTAITANAGQSPAGVQLGTSTSATGASALGIGKSAAGTAYSGQAHIFSEVSLFAPLLSDGTQTYEFNTGLFNTNASATLNINNSVGIRYTHGTNAGNFQGFSRDNAGAESVVDLGVAMATSTFFTLRVEINKARDEARFYVNGAYSGRVTGNMPGAVVMSSRTNIVKSVGITARQITVFNQVFGAVYN